MTLNFKAGPDDAQYVKLAAPLLQGIASPFNAWLTEMIMRNETGADVTKATCIAFGTLLALLTSRAAVPGNEAEFRKVVADLIHKAMTFADGEVPRARDN